MGRRAIPVHADFEAAFTGGQVFRSAEGEMPVRQVFAGTLVAPSGKIIACDPSFLNYERHRIPFRRAAPAGRYPVHVAVLEAWGDRVACARIRFGRTRPVRWEMATLPGQRLSDLKPNQHFGYGVDSATGCFIDAAALDTETYQFERGAADQLVTAMSRYPVKGGLCGVIPVRRWGGPTLVGFSTGLGDGFYSSYWGFDAAGHLVTLDSDFGLLTEAVHAEAVFEGIAGRLGEMLQDPRMRRLGFSVRVPRTAGRAKPLTVVQEGSASGLSVRFVIGGDIFTRRASTHQEGRVTHVYEITRDRLTPEASLQLEFVEGFKPLQPSAAVRP